MTTYTLSIQFDQASIDTIYANGQYLNISKYGGIAGDPQSVVWLSWHPMTGNIVTWQENYYLYATRSETQAGATITTSTNIPAIVGRKYVLDNTGFHDAGEGAPKGTIYLTNNSDFKYFCGLAQPASVSGESSSGLNALNQVVVPAKQSASFAPIVRLWAYIGMTANNGAVASSVSSTPFEINYTYETNQSIVWVAATQSFQKMSSFMETKYNFFLDGITKYSEEGIEKEKKARAAIAGPGGAGHHHKAHAGAH